LAAATASYAGGLGTVAGSPGQHVFGIANEIDNDGEYIEIVGGGSYSPGGITTRHNIRTLNAAGHEWLYDGLTIAESGTLTIGETTINEE